MAKTRSSDTGDRKRR